MFSQIIDEALAQEKQAQDLVTKAQDKANKAESEAQNQANSLIKEAKNWATELTNQALQKAKEQEALLDKQSQQQMIDLKNNLLSHYRQSIEEAAGLGVALLMQSSVKV